MKTIEERAEETYPKGVGIFTSAGAELLQKAYIHGAKEQQEIDGNIVQNACNAVSLMHYLDEHCPKNKMCLSNMECADLEKAFMSGNWEIVIRYIKKYKV